VYFIVSGEWSFYITLYTTYLDNGLETWFLSECIVIQTLVCRSSLMFNLGAEAVESHS